MDAVHNYGVDFVQFLQQEFKDYDELMLTASHLGDPRNAFLLYFPLAYCLHRPTGVRVLWLASLSEWINALLKWVMHGDRPYWWIKDPRAHHHQGAELQQYRLTCETGPGSPSGHAMVTSSVVFCLVVSFIHLKRPRLLMRGLIWLSFVVFMFAVNVSRLFIATHFPHQVLFGTLVGILLTVLVDRVDLAHVKLLACIAASVVMPLSCLATFYTLKWIGLDPQWSISLATKYCANPDWVHLDTTLFNSVYRDAGSLLGFGIFVSLSSIVFKRSLIPVSDSIEGEQKKVQVPVWTNLLAIVLCLVLCQIGENLKPGMHSAEFYYFVTFIKFCTLTFLVMFISDLIFNRNVKGGKSI